MQLTNPLYDGFSTSTVSNTEEKSGEFTNSGLDTNRESETNLDEEIGTWDVSLGEELPFSIIENANNHMIRTTFLDEMGSEGLLILNFNANSILANDGGKLIELSELMQKTSPVVVGITETWLNESNCNEEVEIEGYNLIRKDRIGKKGRWNFDIY